MDMPERLAQESQPIRSPRPGSDEHRFIPIREKIRDANAGPEPRIWTEVHTKASDQPPAKFNVGVSMKNSLVASGCIVNGSVENSILFKHVYVGNNTIIRNSIIMNDAYIGDNAYIENAIVESGDTIQANAYYPGDDGIRIILEKSERYNMQ